MTVNDGKGLYDNIGVTDTIISDFNTLPKLIIDNQFIKAAAVYASIGQRLVNLKKGIKADLESKDKIIEELKQMNNALVEQQTGLPVDKEGAENGAD